MQVKNPTVLFNKTTKQNAADRKMSDRWVILVRMDCIPASLLIYILLTRPAWQFRMFCSEIALTPLSLGRHLILSVNISKVVHDIFVSIHTGSGYMVEKKSPVFLHLEH